LKSWIKWCAIAAVGALAAGAAALLAAYVVLAPGVPDVSGLKDIHLQVPLRIFTRDGRLIAQIGEQRRIPVEYDEIPDRVINAFLAAEDEHFFSHGGIDTSGLLRALMVTAMTGEARQGGSTITMQLARNMFLSPEKHLQRKLREILLAFRIEHEFSKREILTLYLNKIFLGQRAYGVAAAADVYYGKNLSELTLAEAATIASLPKAPSTINPIVNPDRTRQRRNYVLRRMLELGFINDAEFDAANATPIETFEHGPRIEVEAPYVAEMVRSELAGKYGDGLYSEGFEVVTTIDSHLQYTANWALRAGLLEYDRRHGYRGAIGHTAHLPQRARELTKLLERFNPTGGLEPALVMSVAAHSADVWLKNGRRLTLPWDTGLSWAAKGKNATATDVVSQGDVVYVLPTVADKAILAQVPQVQGSLVALDPRDGAIVSLVGGFDYYTSKFNRVTQAKRQPGSGFKPFIYSAALEYGFTPATFVLDAPIVIRTANNELWRPENDAHDFMGPIAMRSALAQSRNLVSIRILRAVGIDNAIDYASRFGFSSEQLPNNLTMALGTAQLSPLEVTRGYATFANGGFRVTPYFIDRIVDPKGQIQNEANPALACYDCATEVTPPLPINPNLAAAPTPSGDSTASDATSAAPQTFTAYLAANKSPLTQMSDVAGSLPTPANLAPRVISAANAFIMTDMMRDVIRKGTARRALVLKRDDLAGKTGTTNQLRDTWFTGFNSDLVADVWVGFDQERSLGAGEEGGHTALPVWIYFMQEALKNRPLHSWPQPAEVETDLIDPNNGELASNHRSNAVNEYFFKGRLPGAGALNGIVTDPANDAKGSEHLF
jgi:penicillin-binding protein 1A